MNWRSIDYRILVTLGVLGFILIAFLYAIEIAYFNRYLSFPKFISFSLGFGLLLGGLAAWHFSKKPEDAYDKMRLRVGLVVAGLIFGPLLFSLLNRHLDPWPKQLESVEFVSLEGRFSSRFGVPKGEDAPGASSFHVYFYRNTKLTRIVFNKKLELETLEKGDYIYILIRRGLFGLNWVQSVQNETD